MQIDQVDLVLKIRREIQVRLISSYEKIFSAEILETYIKNQYLKEIQFYQSLSEEQKTMLSPLVRQVICDTVSVMFAWLDSSFFIEGQSKELELRYEGEKDKLNGNLTDIWWQIEQGLDIDELRKFYNES